MLKWAALPTSKIKSNGPARASLHDTNERDSPPELSPSLQIARTCCPPAWHSSMRMKP